MTRKPDIASLQKDIRTRRVRDFVILGVGTVGILTLLLLTGAIGLAEWVTASVVVVAGALAYYVGSQPAPIDLSQIVAEPSLAESPDDVVGVFRPFILSLPFPALLIGSDRRLSAANAPARAVFGLGTEERLLVSAAIREPDLLKAFARIAETGASEKLEFSVREDAESWLAHMQAGPDPGSVVVVLEDTTAVRRAEQARADFLANASHELRTPLTAIAGFIETMRGPARNDRDRWDGFLDIMFHQTERMKRLVADLLSLSRIEFSEHRSPSGRVDLAVLAGGASISLQPLATDADVRLILRNADLSLPVIADGDEIMQVIQNLTSNAIKYSGTGKTVSITVGQAANMAQAAELCARQMPDANRAVLLAPRASSEVPAAWLRVEDQGSGIPSQHLPRLGERFYRVDESRGGAIEGTGLGLAIVKHIMARHRGGLAVESRENAGSAFGVWLPLAPDTLTGP